MDEKLASFLLEAMADGFSVLREDGAHRLVNPAFCRMVGFTKEELIAGGPPPHPYWPEEHMPDILRAFEEMEAGKDVRARLIFCKKDGTRFPVMVHPATAKVRGETLHFATVQDLTEIEARARREEELRALVETMIRAGDLATWVWNLQDGTSTVSDSYFTVLGYAPGAWEPGYDTWASLIHPDDLPATEASMQGLLAHEDRLYDTEHRMRDANGQWRWVLVRGYVTEWDEAGGPTRITGTMQDIHRLKTQELKLRQFEKMEVLGQLTGGIAHDFNNILTTLAGNLGLLEMSAEGEQKELVSEMHEGVRRAESLVQSLLRYARRKSKGLVSTELHAFLERTEKVLRTAVPEPITLRLEHGDGELGARCDVDALENALLNLVVNARDACGPGGTIVIRTGRRVVSEEEASGLDTTPGEYAFVAVCDDGPGMSPEVKRRALEPLFTTKSEGTGTGLGLSMVQRAMRDAGGFVGIESEFGRGATVTLHLPAASATPSLHARAEDATLAGSESLLLVDDEEGLLRVMAAGLRALGYDVTTCASPDEALRHLGSVDALVTDIVMPYAIDGVELARRARGERPDLPVVLMTGYAREEREQAARELGRVLWKPFRVEQLAGEIRRALDATRADEAVDAAAS